MPKPNIAVLGYALFVTINATSLWGGVFPFFPMEFHTPEVTILFFLSQALAYCATFFLTMLVAYRRPEFVHKTLVLIAMALAIAGAISLIAAMYLKWLTISLVVCGGVCLGMGCGALPWPGSDISALWPRRPASSTCLQVPCWARLFSSRCIWSLVR